MLSMTSLLFAGCLTDTAEVEEPAVEEEEVVVEPDPVIEVVEVEGEETDTEAGEETDTETEVTE